MSMKLWTLFISYRFGGHYCGVYTSLEIACQVIKEMVEDMEIRDKFIPNKRVIQKHLLNNDDYFYEFDGGTWIHVQEVSEMLVDAIVEQQKKTKKEVKVGTYN